MLHSLNSRLRSSKTEVGLLLVVQALLVVVELLVGEKRLVD
jgi:hypothetical protein